MGVSYHALREDANEVSKLFMNLIDSSQIKRVILYAVFTLLASGCFTRLIPPDAPLDAPATPTQQTQTPTAIPTTPAGLTLPDGWTDETATVRGICFEAALDAAGRVFVIRDAEQHIQFYSLADNSGLCRRPVERLPFDFSGGRVLAGVWSAGTGCTARHEVIESRRDAGEHRLTLRFITEGDCPYELVRPFWVGVTAGEAEVVITVEG